VGATGAVGVHGEGPSDGADVLGRPVAERVNGRCAWKHVAVQEGHGAVGGEGSLVAFEEHAEGRRRCPLRLGPELLALNELLGVRILGEHDAEAGGGDGGHFKDCYTVFKMSLYDRYIQCIEEQLKNTTLTFKSEPRYKDILEHVSPYQGLEYFGLIHREFPEAIDSMRAYVAANDSVGHPDMTMYGTLLCSPTSLRYVFHAHLILAHARRLGLTDINVVELGAGYGGLCFALHYFANAFGVTLTSYTLLDLPQANALQERYLQQMPMTGTLRFVSSETFGKDVSAEFLVSNYAFSELPHSLQQEYLNTLFPKIKHGFMAWNFIPVYDFGIPIISTEVERPLTGDYNKFVLF